MTIAEAFASFGIPENARVSQRIPKKLLMESGAAGSADKKLIQSGLDEMLWLAVLKPTNIGVAELRSDDRAYLEISIVSAKFSADGKYPRLVELIHRAIPYPVVLIAEQRGKVGLSVAHKRVSRADSGQMVLDGEIVSVPLDNGVPKDAEKAFVSALAMSAQPTGNMFALYHGWVDALRGLSAATITGEYTLDPKKVTARRELLAEHERLQTQVVLLRSRAKSETQIAQRVEMNLQIKRLEKRLAEVKGLL